MKKSTVGMIAGSTALLSAGTVMAVSKLKNKDENNYNKQNLDPDANPDMGDVVRKDQLESPDADEVDAEKGLSLLDHEYRADWQANGFPQTRKEMEELEKGERGQ